MRKCDKEFWGLKRLKFALRNKGIAPIVLNVCIHSYYCSYFESILIKEIIEIIIKYMSTSESTLFPPISCFPFDTNTMWRLICNY